MHDFDARWYDVYIGQSGFHRDDLGVTVIPKHQLVFPVKQEEY